MSEIESIKNVLNSLEYECEQLRDIIKRKSRCEEFMDYIKTFLVI